MKKLLLLSWALLAALPALSQDAAPASDMHLIPSGRLAWSDFPGPVDPASPYAATTDWRVTYTYRPVAFRHDTVRLDVQAQALVKTSSWVRPGRQTDALLAHEQGHYDIALLMVAIFRKQTSLMVFTRGTYRQQIQELFAGLLAEIKQLQVQYDTETNHGRDPDAQSAWERKLKELLKVAAQ